MGRTHARSGAVAWLAAGGLVDRAAPAVAAHGAAETAAAALVCAGAALLPDLDHPSSTIAHSLGAVTRVLARGIARASGGHRHATHSVAAAAAAGGLAWWAGSAGTWWSALPVLLLAALAVTALGVTHTPLAVAGGALAAHLAGWSPGWWPA